MGDQTLHETAVAVPTPSRNQQPSLLPQARQPSPSAISKTAGKAIQAGDGKDSPSVTVTEKAQKSDVLGSNHVESREKHLRDIHWVSPFSMVSLLLFGVLMSICHHFYYHSLVGKVVGDVNDQQRTHRFVFHFD
jgi:hypothetical protein